jgi:hypothetical protein
MNRNKKKNSIFHKFRKNYYEPTIRGIKQYIEPITNIGGTIGEGIYATKAFLPYSYQPTAELISKGLMGTQRAIEVGLDVAKAKDYATAIENSKRIIPAIKAGQDVYGNLKQNYLINQARNRYNPANDILQMPEIGTRAFEFMRTLGTNDGMSNRAD